jgi:hypothetical protein
VLVLLCWGPIHTSSGRKVKYCDHRVLRTQWSRLSIVHAFRDRAPLAVNYCVTVSATTRPKLRHTRLKSETKRISVCVVTGGEKGRDREKKA